MGGRSPSTLDGTVAVARTSHDWRTIAVASQVSPDPSGYATGAVEIGPLKATDGSFNYELPGGIDPSAFRSVVIWCQPFEVQFAHAELRAG